MMSTESPAAATSAAAAAVEEQWKTPTNGLLTRYRLEPSSVDFSNALAQLHSITFSRLEYTMQDGTVYLMTFQARSACGRCVTASSAAELVGIVLCSLLK